MKKDNFVVKKDLRNQTDNLDQNNVLQVVDIQGPEVEFSHTNGYDNPKSSSEVSQMTQNHLYPTNEVVLSPTTNSHNQNPMHSLIFT